MKKGFFLSSVALMALGALAGCGNGGGGGSSGSKTNIGEVKVWCDEKVVESVTAQINKYAETSDYSFTLKVEPMGEGDAAGNMINDPKAGADVYFFAQDQLSRLITAKAIADLPSDAANTVKGENDDASVQAATVNNKVYAYPATSDNTYFMYYDKSVYQGVDMTDLSAIITKTKQANKKIYYNTSSAWYNAAFFYGAGAHSEWTTDKDGNFTAHDDTYNSAAGKKAVRGMIDLCKDATIFVDSSENGAFTKGAGVLISGTWAKSDVQTALGNNMAAAVLPKYTVDGTKYQLKSYSGFKLVGTKPQTTNERAAAVKQIALAITNKEAQLTRFKNNGWGPSNKGAQQDSEVQADPVLKAVFAQMALATPQGQYPGKWWDHAGAIGKNLSESSNVDLILQTYEDGLDALLS